MFDLRKLLGLDHPQQHQQAHPQTQPAQYAQYMNQDGSGGGFGPNNPSQLQVQRQHSPANLGVPYGQNPTGEVLNQGGQYNPGFTPLQNSGFGPGGNPQIGAFQDQPGQLNAPQYNPQDNQRQQYWLQ
jgi:hypothetical protein